MSLDDICSRLPECPKDMISTTLDVLQILGIVMQREVTQNTSGIGTFSVGTTVLCPVNFSKLPWIVSIDKLEEEVSKKAEESQRMKARLEALYVRT
jgi:hypothetical protein